MTYGRATLTGLGLGLGLVMALLSSGCAAKAATSTPSLNVASRSSNTISSKVQKSVSKNGTGLNAKVGTPIENIVPQYVAWNGYAYEEETSKFISSVGPKIGIAMNSKSEAVYRVPGRSPNQVIAVVPSWSHGKFVVAVRKQFGVKWATFATSWMTFDSQKIGRTLQPGEDIVISGHVFFRVLYATTIQASVTRDGYGKDIALQRLKVSDTGQFKGVIDIPKQLPGKLGKTGYDLSFWVPGGSSTMNWSMTLK